MSLLYQVVSFWISCGASTPITCYLSPSLLSLIDSGVLAVDSWMVDGAKVGISLHPTKQGLVEALKEVVEL